MVPNCVGDTTYRECNCGRTGCSGDYNCDPNSTIGFTVIYLEDDKDDEKVIPRWHPGTKELRAMFPEIKVKPHKVIFSKPKFHRKLLFSFSGYLPKRVRGRMN